MDVCMVSGGRQQLCTSAYSQQPVYVRKFLSWWHSLYCLYIRTLVKIVLQAWSFLIYLDTWQYSRSCLWLQSLDGQFKMLGTILELKSCLTDKWPNRATVRANTDNENPIELCFCRWNACSSKYYIYFFRLWHLCWYRHEQNPSCWCHWALFACFILAKIKEQFQYMKTIPSFAEWDDL